MAEVLPIPSPPRLPLLGNLGEFTTTPVADLIRLADTYGSIYRLYLGNRPIVVVGRQEFANELCDERRFHKTMKTVLEEVRNGARDGLFTAFEGEPSWGKAHRILIPAFGPLPIRGMFEEMHDIATQMCMKFARHGPETAINVSDDFTRLALDTLALCSMNFRFNSFYRDDLHPFIQAMGDFLPECDRRLKRPPFAPNFLYRAANEKYFADIAMMRKVALGVVEARRKSSSDRKDLLAAMLDGVDPQTGEKLDDENITSQLITFLIAGHDTTSGTLSFSLYMLLKHPEAYQKVQQEVDQVIGRDPIRVDHMTKLPYITAVLREVLRLCAPIPVFSVEAREDTLLGGKYLVHKGESINVLLKKVHVDPAVYGEDVNEFKPERMLDDNFAKLNEEFPNCWKPFGNGKRACIGRPFAWQEAVLALAMMFQNFEFTMDDPNYTLKIKETLTLKPDDFKMRATIRHGMSPTELEHRLAGKAVGPTSSHLKNGKVHDTRSTTPPPEVTGKPIAVYYGSNSGTCEALAQRLATDASLHGFRASTVSPLDAAARSSLPTDQPVVIITASYEGQPPSNAAHFVGWIESLKGEEEMKNVSYAVFACGHRDWTQTFFRIPKLVDATLERLGGTRLVSMGSADAGASDMFSDFETWEDETLWPALKERYGTMDSGAIKSSDGGFSVDITTPRKATLRQDVEEALVVSTKTLTASGPPKKHIEIQLPSAMTYRAGDYLAILPLNPKSTVSRVFRRFELAWDSALKIQSSLPTTLPTDTTVPAFNIFSAYVELSQPATKRNVLALIEATEDQTAKEKLEKLAGDDYQEHVSAKRVSVLDLLEQFPSVGLPIGSYLAMLPPMRVRQYSISSSPLADVSRCTLTYSVLDEPSLSGQGRHVGVATNFLSELSAGEKLHVAVRPSASAFHLPHDPEKTPIICIGAGTGIAPFRGFIQERAAMLAAGRDLAPALLFFGCRDPAVDDIYAEELARWQDLGAVDVRRAYSRAAAATDGCRYVQDRLRRDADDVYELWDRGAKVYICGSRELGKAVEDACVQLVIDKARKEDGKETTEEEARAWLDKNRKERFATDVFD